MELKLFESFDDATKILEPNVPRLVKAAEQNICIIRRTDDLIAFINECPHLGESLHRGIVNSSNEIVCPLHTYRFDLNSGEEADKRCSSLKFIHVFEKAGAIYLKV